MSRELLQRVNAMLTYGISDTIDELKKDIDVELAKPGQKPLNHSGQFSINIIHDPANKTQFNRSDIIGYEGSPNKLLVAGESEAYLHTFVVDSGDYWGIFKDEANLSCLIRKSIEPEQKPLSDDEINQGMAENFIIAQEAFRLGIKFAEKKHGITDPEQSKPQSNAI